MIDYKKDYKTSDANWFVPNPVLTTKYDLEVSFLRTHPDAKIPVKANEDDAGWDLYSTEEVTWSSACGPKTVPTGLKMIIPPGWEAQIRPRSGLSLKGWLVCNSPGTIDAGYRGEIMIIMKPVGGVGYLLKGSKVAQIVFKRVPSVSVKEISVEEFDKNSNTTRGTGGFGSTGM